ncbi:hypothetical protein EDB89DRAFT_2131094 [Lactarius sanguifluus]|nr:hypothetical protein EDB89DRAFT_2131094 [Lactarius sanguifluus]
MSLCRDIRNARASASARSVGNDTPVPDHQQFSFGTTTPTPTRGVRRYRDSDDYNINSDIIRSSSNALFTPGTTKRLKTSCDDIAHQFEVDPAQLRDLANSRDVPDMLLRLMARLLKLEKLFAKNEFEVLLKSPEFRTDSRLPSFPLAYLQYVTDVAARMTRVIEKQWKIFKVPKEIFEDPDYRSRLETTIEASFKDNGDAIHISILVTRLFPKGVYGTTANWARVAFLRSALRDFVRFTGLKKPAGALCQLRERDPTDDHLAVTGPGDDTPDTPTGIDNYNVDKDVEDDGPITGKQYTQQQFWNYVDDYLEYIRTDLFKDIPDRPTRNSKIMQLFNEGLQIDMFNYQEGRKPPAPSGELPGWQETLQRSTCCLFTPIELSEPSTQARVVQANLNETPTECQGDLSQRRTGGPDSMPIQRPKSYRSPIADTALKQPSDGPMARPTGLLNRCQGSNPPNSLRTDSPHFSSNWGHMDLELPNRETGPGSSGSVVCVAYYGNWRDQSNTMFGTPERTSLTCPIVVIRILYYRIIVRSCFGKTRPQAGPQACPPQDTTFASATVHTLTAGLSSKSSYYSNVNLPISL